MSLIKKTDHFYLIDGSGYIFRAYYALPPLSRKSDGLPTGAVNGFCTMLYKLLEDSRSDAGKNKPTHFVVIFDLFLILQGKILEMKYTKTIKQIDLRLPKILFLNLNISENQ
jgi:5'-3' exonuclease